MTAKCYEAGEQGKVIIVVNLEFVYGPSSDGLFVERFCCGRFYESGTQIFNWCVSNVWNECFGYDIRVMELFP